MFEGLELENRELRREIQRVWEANFQVYGVRLAKGYNPVSEKTGAVHYWCIQQGSLQAGG